MRDNGLDKKEYEHKVFDNTISRSNDSKIKEFQVDRSNFSHDELNEKRKKNIRKVVAVTTSIISVSLIAGGGISIGKTVIEPATVTINDESYNIVKNSRTVEYNVELEIKGEASIRLFNGFYNKEIPLVNGVNSGVFENLLPETEYNIQIVSNDIFRTTFKKETFITPAVSKDDLYVFTKEAYTIKSDLEYVVYYDESRYNPGELKCIFTPDLGEEFILDASKSGLWSKVNLNKYNLMYSTGTVELVHYIDGKYTKISSKPISFSKKQTYYKDITFTPAKSKEDYFIIDFEFKDENNIWSYLNVNLTLQDDSFKEFEYKVLIKTNPKLIVWLDEGFTIKRALLSISAISAQDASSNIEYSLYDVYLDLYEGE